MNRYKLHLPRPPYNPTVKIGDKVKYIDSCGITTYYKTKRGKITAEILSAPKPYWQVKWEDNTNPTYVFKELMEHA